MSPHPCTRLDESVVYDYAAQPKVSVPVCPLCRTPNRQHRALDRCGYEIGVSGCGRCGLVYLNPRLTAQGYATFYREAYRPLVKALHGDNRHDHEHERLAGERGQAIGRLLKAHGGRTASTLLDVGGGTGVFAVGVCEALGWRTDQITVVDPNVDELAEARRRGCATVEGLVETMPAPEATYDLIVCAQTTDHWLDPLAALRWLRQALAVNGRLWVDIVDAREWRKRHPFDAWKIDHPLYWSPQSFRYALRHTAWQILRGWHPWDRRGCPILTRCSYLCEGV